MEIPDQKPRFFSNNSSEEFIYNLLTKSRRIIDNKIIANILQKPLISFPNWPRTSQNRPRRPSQTPKEYFEYFSPWKNTGFPTHKKDEKDFKKPFKQVLKNTRIPLNKMKYKCLGTKQTKKKI